MPERRPLGGDGRRLDVVHEADSVLGAGPDPPRLPRHARLVQRHGPEVTGGRDVKADGPAIGGEVGGVAAAVGVEDEARPAVPARRAPDAGLVGEAGEAAGAVPAHRPERAVGVAVAHAEVGPVGVGGVEGEEAVGADAEAAGAVAAGEAGELLVGEAEEPVVEDDEVVAGPVHLGEGDDEGAGAHGRGNRCARGR